MQGCGMVVLAAMGCLLLSTLSSAFMISGPLPCIARPAGLSRSAMSSCGCRRLATPLKMKSSKSSPLDEEFNTVDVTLSQDKLSRDDKRDIYEELFKARQEMKISTTELRRTLDQIVKTSGQPLGIDGQLQMPVPKSGVAVLEKEMITEGCDGEHCIIDGEETDAKGFVMPASVARGLVLLSAAFYGTNFGSVKILEETLPPSLAAGLRFSIAAIVMSPLLRTLRPEAVKDGVVLGGIVATGYIAQGLSLQTTDASTAAFLCSLAVMVCPLLDAINGKKVSTATWVAASMAVVGAGILELGGASAPGWGDVLAMIQPVAFGAGFWFTEKAMRKFPDQSAPLTACMLGVIGLITTSWALVESHGLPSAEVIQGIVHNPQVVTALLWTGLITTALTVYLETVALGALSSAETTLLFSTEPLWGTAFASVMLHEHIGVNTMVGGALILSACMGRVAGPRIASKVTASMAQMSSKWDNVKEAVSREPTLKAKIAAGIACVMAPDFADVL